MTEDAVSVSYESTEGERILRLRTSESGVILTQPAQGYGMVVVRNATDGTEIERYYALDMALDHAAEVLGVDPSEIEVPDAAADMGM